MRREADQDYWMSSRPDEDGPPAYDMLQGDMMPDDIYTRPQIYTGFREYLPEVTRALAEVRGKPEAEITVYRAQQSRGLNNGDWVTLTKDYALRDLQSDPEEGTDRGAYSYRVKAKDVRYAGDDLMEWGYFGPPVATPLAKIALPSWRDRGEHPTADVYIAPDLGRARRNSYEVFLKGQPAARRPSLAEAKAFIEDQYGPQAWVKVEGDQNPHHDPTWGMTTMFNDASYFYVVEHLTKQAIPFLHLVTDQPIDPKSMEGFEHTASYEWIHPQIATGGAMRYATDLRQIKRAGVVAIVSGRRDFDDSLLTEGKDMGIKFLSDPTPDNGEGKPTSWFKAAIDFCLPFLKRGSKVYIHCHAGMNRGPSLAYAVLRAYTGCSHEEAMRAIHSVRDFAPVAYAADADKALVELGYAKALTPGISGQPFHTLTGSLVGESYMGRAGDRSHITRNEKGMIPTSVVAHMLGESGEIPGEHRNKQGAEWDEFVADIKANGIRKPIFIVVDPGQQPKISEGNHRRDAAVEAGLPEVPVNIRYFGKAEDQGLVAPEVEHVILPPAARGWDGTIEATGSVNDTVWYHGCSQRRAEEVAQQGGFTADYRPVETAYGEGLYLTSSPATGNNYGDMVTRNQGRPGAMVTIRPTPSKVLEAKSTDFQQKISDLAGSTKIREGNEITEVLRAHGYDAMLVHFHREDWLILLDPADAHYVSHVDSVPRREFQMAAAYDPPEGITYEYTPDRGTEGRGVTGPGAMIEAKVDGQVIGGLAWFKTFVAGPMGHQAGQVEGVFVEEPYQHHGIASEMWRQAKEIEPRLHHSHALTDDGRAWSRTVATVGRTFFHGTSAPLAPGAALGGVGMKNYTPETYAGDGVYLAEDMDTAYFYAVFGAFSRGDLDAEPHVYACSAPEAKYNRPGEWLAPTATVEAEVTHAAAAAFARDWAQWKDLIHAATSGGIPTTAMTIYEFESRLKRAGLQVAAAVDSEHGSAEGSAGSGPAAHPHRGGRLRRALRRGDHGGPEARRRKAAARGRSAARLASLTPAHLAGPAQRHWATYSTETKQQVVAAVRDLEEGSLKPDLKVRDLKGLYTIPFGGSVTSSGDRVVLRRVEEHWVVIALVFDHQYDRAATEIHGWLAYLKRTGKQIEGKRSQTNWGWEGLPNTTHGADMMPVKQVLSYCFDWARDGTLFDKSDSYTYDSMMGLVDSIEAEGVKTPAVLRRNPDGSVTCVDGNHRAAAADYAGVTAMPILWEHEHRTTAGARGDLPPGIEYRHSPPTRYPGEEDDRGGGFHQIQARHDGRQVGYLQWYDPEEGPYGWKGAYVEKVEVATDYRRKGLASEMMRRAKEITPGIQHAEKLTGDGRAWRDSNSPNEAGRPAYPKTMQNRLGSLPTGLFWRTQDPSRPFGIEDAKSRGIFGPGKAYNPRLGYSCLDNPWDLWVYVLAFGWMQPKFIEGDEVIAFSGERKRSKGNDGEPLAVPDMATVKRYTWPQFEAELLRTSRPAQPGGPGAGRPAFLQSWGAVANAASNLVKTSPVAAMLWKEQAEAAGVPADQIKRMLGAVSEPEWLINGKPYRDGVWIEVEPDVWYRGADHAKREIPSRLVVRRQGDKWAWEAQVLTFIGAPHENKNPHGVAKTLEDAQARAERSLAKDHEFYQRYDDRQRATLEKDHLGSTEAPDEHWRPETAMYGLTQDHLDPRVFDGDHMKPEVRAYGLKTLDEFWRPLYGDWTQWAVLYLAGSGASYWWAGDTDLDFLIGVDLDRLRQARPANKDATDEEILAHLNAGLISDLRPATPPYQPIAGMNPMDVTYYVNPGSYDIRDLHPYAAYNVSTDQWAVRPQVVDEAREAHLIPDNVWRMCEAAAREAEQVLSLPEPDRTIAGVTMFDWVHEGRQVAYSVHGQGWLDPGNVIYRYLEQHPRHLLRALYLCKHPEAADQHDLDDGAATHLVPATASSLTLENIISVAEEVMERGHLDGPTFSVPKPSLSEYSDGVWGADYKAAVKEASDFVNGVLTDHGHPGGIRIYCSGYDMEGAQAATDGMNSIQVKRTTVNALTLLHECAHILLSTPEGEGHSQKFVDTVAGLYGRYLSPAAEAKFRQIVTSVKAGAKTAEYGDFKGGTIYRGLRASFSPEVDAKIRDLLAMETDEESYAKWKDKGGKKVQIADLIIPLLERSSWDAGSGVGLGRHWSERREMAEGGAMQGGAGDWAILLTATYDPSDVDPEFDPTAPFMKAESEVRLKPGAPITITQVDLLNTHGFFQSKGERVSYRPIQATAGIDPDRQGKCYPLAYEYLMDQPDDDAVLVHGTVTTGIGHAWVESHGKVYDPVLDDFIDRDLYYRDADLGGAGAKPEKIYTIEQAQAAANDHYGPWHEAKTAATTMDDEWFRGVTLTLHSADPRTKPLLHALATGSTNVVRDRLIEALGGGTGMNLWEDTPNGPRSGAGKWWTSSETDAWNYAVNRPDWQKDELTFEVLFHAHFKPESEDDEWFPDGQGHYWPVLTPGHPITIFEVEADLPTPQQAKHLLDLLDKQGAWQDVEGMHDIATWQDPWINGEIQTKRYRWDLHMQTVASVDPRIIEAENEFLARDHIPGADQWDAEDQCYSESKKFEALLLSKGIDCSIIMGWKTDDFMGHQVITQGHVGVRVGDRVWDWTARQFNPRAPVPQVMSVAEWEHEWPDVLHKKAVLTG